MTDTSFSVQIFPTRQALGKAAAADAAALFAELLREKETLNVIFAAAPSQNEFLDALVHTSDVAFDRINAFHMDEYVGLPKDAPQGFGNFLRNAIFDRVPFRSVAYLDGSAADIGAECARYAALLEENPPDAVCMGVGENGHIAFNDPSVADFDDPCLVKRVRLEEVCRMQQVHDGCFRALSDVPTSALTLSVRMLLRARHHFCVVPTALKAKAVRGMIYGEIGTHCPATALRLSPDARVYLDEDSAGLL